MKKEDLALPLTVNFNAQIVITAAKLRYCGLLIITLIQVGHNYDLMNQYKVLQYNFKG